MKIPYRVTSGMAAAATVVLPIVSAFLPPRPSRPLPQASDGAVAWDPCTTWVQYAPMYRLVLLVCLAAFTVFMVQGLRNRPGPRWLAIAGVPALAAAIMSDWWQMSADCYSAGSVKLLFLWAGIVSLMFLHHSVQPRATGHDEQGSVRRSWSALLACRGIFRVLAFLPIAWSVLNVFRDVRHGDNATFVPTAIVAIQHCIAWTTSGLFLLGASLVFYLLVVRLRSATRV